MEQRTQPVQRDSEPSSVDELLAQSREPTVPVRRTWPVFAWLGALAVTFGLGAQLSGLVSAPPVLQAAAPTAIERERKSMPPMPAKPEVAIAQPTAPVPELEYVSWQTNDDLLIGMQLLSQHELAGAKQRADRCLANDDSNSRCHALLAQVYAEQGDQKASIAQHEQAQKLEPDPVRGKRFANELRRLEKK